MNSFSFRWLGLLGCLMSLTVSAAVIESDLCVYGGTSGGVAAAVQARRLGRTVALVEMGRHLGGLTTGGLGSTDIGNKAAIGGVAREFYRRLGAHYGTEEAWKFEAGVAERLFVKMTGEAGVPVYYNQRLARVKKEQGSITEIIMEDGTVYRARMFIDATYEGDLMAGAKVSYTVGREANATYQETLNGVRATTPKHQFEVSVDPYVKPGDPASGLLPFIQPGDGGVPGAADKRVQTYNFRLVLTQNPTNRLPIQPSAAYDPARFEVLARYLEALQAGGFKTTLDDIWSRHMMPNGKTDINNSGAFSTDYIGANYDYPEGDWATRERIWKDHENYTRDLLHFLATSPRVPEVVRTNMQSWGLCRDEFPDTGGWPYALYVREARRLVSDYVMSEHNCRGTQVAADPIGLGAYNMDSHNCQRIVKSGRVENEGDVQVPVSPYPISYRSIVPKETECKNLLVPVCLSASHIAYGSIRMEPVFMILGQSAATAADLALKKKCAVQQVDYTELRSRLLQDKQVLEWKAAPRKTALKGTVLDDVQGARTGRWTESSASAFQAGHGYVHDGNTNKGQATISYRPEVKKTGTYELVLLSPAHDNRARNVPVMVRVEPGITRMVMVDQRKGNALLGTFAVKEGGKITVTVSNEGTQGYVVADGLQMVAVGE